MSISFDHPINGFLTTFQLSAPKEIREFFPKDKHRLTSKVKAYMVRLQHYFKTGIWIDKPSVMKYIVAHRLQFQNRKCKISKLFRGMSFERKAHQCEAGICLSSSSYWQNSKESALFLLRFLQSSKTVGSLAPSSNRLAKTIVRQIAKPASLDFQAKRLILEVGPGTGAFTDKIIKRMGPNDELHLVEYDEQFCRLLRKKYHNLLENGKVKIFCYSILDHKAENNAAYDFIVSGLPLNAFDAGFVNDVFEKYESIAKDGGKISYFEYMLIPEIMKLGMEKTARENLCKVLELKQLFYHKHEMTIDKVWTNLTPAFVRHHRVTSSSIPASNIPASKDLLC